MSMKSANNTKREEVNICESLFCHNCCCTFSATANSTRVPGATPQILQSFELPLMRHSKRNYKCTCAPKVFLSGARRLARATKKPSNRAETHVRPADEVS